MTDKQAYELGYQAAVNGECRSWCEAYGSACLRGFDAYWDEFGP